jgi:hypothetical protein
VLVVVRLRNYTHVGGRETRTERKGWPAVVSTLCLRRALDHRCEAPPTTKPRAGTAMSTQGVCACVGGYDGASLRVALTRQRAPKVQ